MNNKKLVKFQNGKWGIRYGWFRYTFQDFYSTSFRWDICSKHFHDCQTNEENARRCFLKPSYEIIEG